MIAESLKPRFLKPHFFIRLSFKCSPEAGLTNAQNLAKYGIAIGGAVAPCKDNKTYPEIEGFACPADVASF